MAHLGWNVIEGVVAIAAAALARSVALLGFGIDSFVESASGAVLVWRLLAERRGMKAEMFTARPVSLSAILEAIRMAWLDEEKEGHLARRAPRRRGARPVFGGWKRPAKAQ